MEHFNVRASTKNLAMFGKCLKENVRLVATSNSLSHNERYLLGSSGIYTFCDYVRDNCLMVAAAPSGALTTLSELILYSCGLKKRACIPSG